MDTVFTCKSCNEEKIQNKDFKKTRTYKDKIYYTTICKKCLKIKNEEYMHGYYINVIKKEKKDKQVKTSSLSL